MPMPVRRKTHGLEKVEIIYRTAHAQNNWIASCNISDHACAMPAPMSSRPAIAFDRAAGLDPGADWASRSGLSPGSQPLPDMSHFAPEFFEYCAGRSVSPAGFAKVTVFRAKLLAMQRAPL